MLTSEMNRWRISAPLANYHMRVAIALAQAGGWIDSAAAVCGEIFRYTWAPFAPPGAKI